MAPTGSVAVRGVCRLCRTEAQLCNSHLIPAGFYRLLRSTTIEPADPLLISPKSTFTTSIQISEHLLCGECEERFRAGGEDWAIRNCYRVGEGFRLHELTLSCTLLEDGELAKFYSAKSNLEIDCAKLAYFAASVFWRASAHAWKFPTINPAIPIALGPYEDKFRTYLLGSSRFPDNAAIWVWISQAEKPSRAITFPSSYRLWECHVHTFDIPGVRFELFLGKTMLEFIKLMCVLKGPDQPILVSDVPDDVLATQVNRLSQTTRLARSLTKRGKWSWTAGSRG